MHSSLPKPPSPVTIANSIAHKLASHVAQSVPLIIKKLPQPPFIVQKTMGEKALQHLMAESVEMGDFDFLQDKWLQINVIDMGLVFFLSFADNQLIMSNRITQADVSFSGNSKEFILLASRNEDPDTLFFQRRLVIEGDTELGLHIKNSIDAIDFDNWPNWLRNIISKVASIVVQQEFVQQEFVQQGFAQDKTQKATEKHLSMPMNA